MRFCLQIDGDKDLLSRLPSDWWDYLCCSYAEVTAVIHLVRCSDEMKRLPFSDGWSAVSLSGCRQVVYAKDRKALFSVRYGEKENEVTVLVRSPAIEYVRLGIQFGMLLALHNRGVGLHGVTMMVGGQTVVLSAPSGTGKTTLAKLLEKYCSGKVINGDFALLSLENNGVWFEPTPFCGTSGVCLNERIRIDQVVFLSQSEENRWQQLTVRQALVRFCGNAFIPEFDELLRRNVQGAILQMLPWLRISGYAFAPTEEAAKLFVSKMLR